MRTVMAPKTKAALVAGFVIFVAGTAGAAYLGSQRSAAPPAAAGQNRATVFYAAQPVDTGTAASAALSQGRIRQKTVAAGSAPAGAVTNADDLVGGVAVQPIAAGTIITAAMFPAPTTRIGTVVIPAGMRALTLKLEPVAGVAGFAGAGDHVDIYAVKKSSDGTPPGVHLVLQAVQVLSVNGTGLPAAQGQPAGPDFVYLLAVTPAEAERLIYLGEFEKLYFDLVAKGEAPVPPTPGADASGVLQAM